MPDPRVARSVKAVGDVLVRYAQTYVPKPVVREEGRVTSVQDGVLHIEHLPSAGMHELLEVGARGTAMVLGLSPRAVEAVAVDGIEHLVEGATVRPAGRAPSVAVGDVLLGRVIDPLGHPLDGTPLDVPATRVPLERRAPHIYERSRVHRPLFTGTLAIDAMLPIGRGQRELVVGDEGTGKTALALDALLRQRDTDVIGVYVAVGRRRAEVRQVTEALAAGGGRWCVVAAPEDSSPTLRYLAPYAGTAVAEHFTYRGEHTLVVYDDLSAHAVAWRELSLLLRRPPGREAYPGDIFYLHARLLERAAQLSNDLGGGSLTALPLATLEGGRLTAYIPTNLISITDGQIVLSQSLFAAGQRPAIDIGLSVSRVGAKAQPQAMRSLAARMKLDYAAFLELESFARIGTQLDSDTERRLALGRRVRRLMRGRRLEPLSSFDEVVRLVLAGLDDTLLTLDEHDLEDFVTEVTPRLRTEHAATADRVERDGVLGAEARTALATRITAWATARERE